MNYNSLTGVNRSMNPNKIPHGQDVLPPEWPDAEWDVGALFVHDQYLNHFLDVIQKTFDCTIPIKSVFGCYGVMWSGGRSPAGTCTAPIAQHSGWTPRALFEEYNKRGIGCTLTFSNTLLEEKHLSDPSSNYLLDMLGEQEYDNNYVTVTSDILSDYIRKKYPNLKQKASIVKSTMEMPKKRTFEYYDNLTERFDQVYLHPDDNLNLKLLKEIADSGKAHRYTSLINELCTRNCSIRDKHYDEISHTVIDGWHGMFNYTDTTPLHLECEKYTKPDIRFCTLSKPEFKEIYDLGFRTFKLQGRDGPWAPIFQDFCTWMVEPNIITFILSKSMGGQHQQSMR